MRLKQSPVQPSIFRPSISRSTLSL
jgi:hypothetical protein